MRNLLILCLVFGAVTTYIFINKSQLFDNDYLGETEETKFAGLQGASLGMEVKEDKVTNIKKIVEMQTDFAKYINGQITFDEMTDNNLKNLKYVYEYPYKAEKGWLFSSGYQPNSTVKVFFQSALTEDRTVVYKTYYHDDGQDVEIIYDGPFFKLVSVDLENHNQVIGWDKNHDPHYIQVRERR